MRAESLKDWLPLMGRWLGFFLKTLGWGCRAVVGCILLWLTAAVFAPPCTFSQTKRGQIATAKAQISSFQTALDLYALDNGRIPTTQQGLVALVIPTSTPPKPQKWLGPYLKDVTTLPVDPLNNPYKYQPDSTDPTTFLIVSYGADGRPGGSGEAADLMNEPPDPARFSAE